MLRGMLPRMQGLRPGVWTARAPVPLCPIWQRPAFKIVDPSKIHMSFSTSSGGQGGDGKDPKDKASGAPKKKPARKRPANMSDDIKPVGESIMSELGEVKQQDAKTRPKPKAAFPSNFIVMPLLKRVPFPGVVTYANAFQQSTLDSLPKQIPKHVALFAVKDTVREALKDPKDFQLTGVDQLHNMGVIAEVILTDKNQFKCAIGLHRCIITGVVPKEPTLTVKAKKVESFPVDKNEITIRALTSQLARKVQQMLLQYQSSPFANNVFSLVEASKSYMQEVGGMADVIVSQCTVSSSEIQQALETLDVHKRLEIVLTILQKEMQLYELQSQIGRQIEEKSLKQQRKFFLTEQMKTIRKELGMELDEKESLVNKFKDRIKNLQLTPAVKKVIEEELAKMQALEPVSSEYNVTRNYVEWLTSLPWGVYGEDSLDLQKAQKVLDEDHYGLKDIKERILEFIAVGNLKGTVQGKIVLLVGPPGVGKTSIGKSVARALGRDFFRFSVGGMTDVSEIKGHRRTYIGAMPGKLIQCMKMVKKSNPVVLIDEIDKLGRGYQGDPAAALLEVLDPEQNATFMDHYLDVPYDLSKVLFICTANVLESIPKPLMDRMEVMTIGGYVPDEQVTIARKHLIPQIRSECGLLSTQAEVSDTALRMLVRSYCRESGVRKLKQHIDKIFRNVAFKIVDGKSAKGKNKIAQPIRVSEKNLVDFVGKPLFTSDRYYALPPVGVVMGLAWTALGGATLYVESATDPYQHKHADLKTTGQMGDVMRESTNIAYTFAKTHISFLAPGNRFFESNSIHMHIPEGATPKDGPSAGCTMITSLLSLAMDERVVDNLAMTGEVTLTGKVLAIGGVREKTIAAKRSGVKVLVIPSANKKDYDEVPANIKEGIKVHYADYYDDVFRVAFPNLSKQISKANMIDMMRDSGMARAKA
eukprot:TRINITY_DN3069_c0_g1_i2.p1 TRINITY_DN3069_c0_g1~~TRINITY_DN3069_c0_g1_i2.p1  ORF type:complete len:927 (+),score=287.73 TRINITY_DN3069_c0_g1_i2:48-2828(+)